MSKEDPRPHAKKSHRKRSRSRDKDERSHKHHRKRSHSDRRSKSKPKPEGEWSLGKIDKEKLLEIAQSNLSQMLRINLEPHKQAQAEASTRANADKSGSVTDFIKLCKNLSQQSDARANEAEEIDSKRKRVKRVFEQIRESSINEADSSSVPRIVDAIKTFPVSSGQQHRKLTEPGDNPGEAQAAESVPFESDEMPGKFKRDSGVKLLTPEQLEGDYKAWVRKDYLMTAEPIKSAIGMKLMEKMGWRSGQGLGKNQEGPLEPIKIAVKVDRKGLVGPKTKGPPSNDPSGDKNPISLLGEFCTSKRWHQPLYQLAHESGPPHMKTFQMKVIVNSVEYLNSQSASTKKQAKTNAAIACLKQMGLAPNQP